MTRRIGKISAIHMMIRDKTGDSHIQFYERSIERIQKMYDGGFVGWQEYSDDTIWCGFEFV